MHASETQSQFHHYSLPTLHTPTAYLGDTARQAIETPEDLALQSSLGNGLGRHVKSVIVARRYEELIMHHVPLRDRLSSCCLVSRWVHAAAVAATQAISVGVYPDEMPYHLTEPVVQTLSHYGQHLACLKLCNLPMVAVLQQLPCPNLLELIMHSGRVQLGAADGYPAVIQCCTKLTRFELWWSNIGIPKGGVLDGLSSLVHLQHLVMLPDNILGGYSVATLPRLQHLMYLGAGSFSTQNLLQLSGLTKL
jgi:hypothetical protein